MMNDPDLQRLLVRERHEQLRRVAGRTRLGRGERRRRGTAHPTD